MVGNVKKNMHGYIRYGPGELWKVLVWIPILVSKGFTRPIYSHENKHTHTYTREVKPLLLFLILMQEQVCSLSYKYIYIFPYHRPTVMNN